MNRTAAASGVVGALIGLVVGGGGVLLWKDSPSSTSATKRSTTTAVIERRSLAVKETTTGELASASEQELTTIGSGTITTAATVGESLTFGGQIARVDDKPTVLMLGSEPVWRAFEEGMTDGADVQQLEYNLVALGFNPDDMTVDDTFTSATAAAVEEFESSLNITEPDGVVDLGEVVFQPAPIQIASSVAAGTRVSAGGALATVRAVDGSGLRLTFSVSQEADRYQVGKPVAIIATNGSSHAAVITALDRVASTGGQGIGGQSTTSFTVTAVPKDANGLTAGPVSVEIPTESANDVLAVPSRALVAVIEGGQAVELVEGGLAAVKVGVFADGWVEVSGDKLKEGAKVVVPA